MAEINIKEKLKDCENAMVKAINHLSGELNNIRAGRANPHILDKIMVDYYGQPTQLSQMANISVPDARTLLISLWDTSALKEVSKAIQTSDLGINPVDDGKNIRLSIPQPTTERRKELVKNIKKMAEDSKIVVRNERRDAIEAFKKAKKDSLMSEDELASTEKEVQKLTDKYIANIDSVIANKEKEVMEV